MMSFDSILKDLEIIRLVGKIESLSGKVCFDSRLVEAGDLFVAVRGTSTDGHLYLSEVAYRGAAVIVCEDLPEKSVSDVAFVVVKDSHKALAVIASNFFRKPFR
jgi:UDP-N-acetylmuramoyl-L-alanyl-D-glutamate--2,6-diaminopimelate ligase